MQPKKENNEEDLLYKQVLRNIAYLRSKGYEDSDPELVTLRSKLREILESRKKLKKDKKKIVPSLVGYKTVALANVETPADTFEAIKAQSKYVLMGTLLGALGVAYYFYRKPK